MVQVFDYIQRKKDRKKERKNNQKINNINMNKNRFGIKKEKNETKLYSTCILGLFVYYMNVLIKF